MITKEQAVAARTGTTFYHCTLKNADGTQKRARVNGKCKTLKRKPEEFSLPMKHGMRDCFYIDPSNCADWGITPTAAVVEGP